MPEVEVPLWVLAALLSAEALVLVGLLGALVVARRRPLVRASGRHRLDRANRERLAAASQRKSLVDRPDAPGAADQDEDQKREHAADRRPAGGALATRLLSTTSLDQALDLLLERLGDSSPVVRRAALAALAELLRDQHSTLEPAHLAAVLRRLVDHLDRPYLLPRAAVGVALLSCPVPSARVMSTHLPVTEVGRAVAVTLLGLVRDPSALTTLVAALTDPSAEVRARACAALAACDAIRAERPLVGVLEDPAWWVRLHAARALGLLGASWAAPALGARLEDEIDHVREEAAQALLLLGPAGREVLQEALRTAALPARRAAGIALQHLADQDRDLIAPLAGAGVLARSVARVEDADVAARVREGLRRLSADTAAVEPGDEVTLRLLAEAVARAEGLPC